MVQCSKCGMMNVGEAVFCSRCGSQLTFAAPVYSQTSQQFQPPLPIYPIPLSQKGRGSRAALFAVIIVVAITVMVILAAVLIASGPNRGSPEASIHTMIDAFNNYDAKGMVDSTVLRFSSGLTYNTTIATLSAEFVLLDQILAHRFVISVTINSVTYRNQMSLSDQMSIDARVSHLVNIGITKSVDDYCEASYTLSVANYPLLSGIYDDILYKIEGSWYFSENPNIF